MGDKDILLKLSKLESYMEEIRIDIGYLKNIINNLVDSLSSNNLRNEMLQRDMIIYEALNEMKIAVNEILNILYEKR
ncbi:MAG: hypothetical protein QXI93_00300 [Candidatus Methanomethylicia archaeon]